jgi:Leucine-rich repeat (LRR) protein
LNLRDKQLEGALKLKGFVKLERLNCQNNQLTNLELSDCKNLTHLDCHKNKFSSLNFLKHVDNLEYLYISDCPELKGNLKPLQSLNKLKELDISNTNIGEGLECLSVSCKMLYCNSDDNLWIDYLSSVITSSSLLINEVKRLRMTDMTKNSSLEEPKKRQAA